MSLEERLDQLELKLVEQQIRIDSISAKLDEVSLELDITLKACEKMEARREEDLKKILPLLIQANAVAIGEETFLLRLN